MMLQLPKILSLFWDASPMSWLQTRTVTTFRELNPDWKIQVYVPSSRSQSSRKYIPDYLGYDHFPSLKEMEGVEIIEVDMERFGAGPEMPDILRSDILRYNLLLEQGGVWSDFDVLWLRPMSDHDKAATAGIPVESPGATVCFSRNTQGWHNIGVLAARAGHPFYQELVDACREKARNIKEHGVLDHQEFGVAMLNAMYPTLAVLQSRHPDVAGVTYDTYYPYGVEELDQLWLATDLTPLHERVMAVHWFNGHPLSKEFLNGSATRDCSMTEIIRRHVLKTTPARDAAPSTPTSSQAGQMVWKHEQQSFFDEVQKFIVHTPTVLDLGCGIRPMTFFQPAVHVLVEPFGEYFEMLRHRYDGIPGVLVVQRDALAFVRALPDASFDSVFLLDVIEHLPKEDGLALIKEMDRVARVQTVIFTPLGFQAQECADEKVDGWGLSGMVMQQHRSGWNPEDFPGDWRIHVCENFHQFNWKGEPVPAFGALFAIRTRKEKDMPKAKLSPQQISALRIMPVLGEPTDASAAQDMVIHATTKLVKKLSHNMESRFKHLEKNVAAVRKSAGRLERDAAEQRQRPRGMRRLRKSIMRLFRGETPKNS